MSFLACLYVDLNKRFCKTRENSNFLKKSKMVILTENPEFSRSRMTKQTSPLKSSHEIELPRRISLDSEVVGISRFFEAWGVG